jgi:DNA-binding CsgD family transcriptional regulator/tetratricopeptide (TPR) repeat protein
VFDVVLAADSISRGRPASAGIPQEMSLATRETGAVGHRVSCPDFVGRAGELDLLGATFDEVGEGRAATVLVGGDAGVGKTRLVQEFCEQARGRGSLAATGVCVPADGGLPYGPVVGILRDLVRQLGESAAAEVLGPLVSGAGLGVPGLGDPRDVYSTVPRMADELAKTRLFESILACFTGLARRSAVVLVFEDLQWADSASAQLVDFLTRNLMDARVLLIGTYRSEELGRDHPLRPWLSELGRHVRVTQLRLGGLDRDETARLIGGILGHQPDWALVEAVWARSQGNPFFAEELTAARHSPSLSAELQGVIMTRVEGLSKEAQQLLRLAATAGATTDHQLLVAVGVLDTGSLEGALAETVDKQILVVDPSRAGYRFRHELLREAVCAALLPGERRRLHHQVATALTADASLGPAGPGHRVAELAAHWWAAGEWAEALSASRSAAEAAIAVWAFPEALAHLERALSALDRVLPAAVPAGISRLELLEKGADVAYMAGDGRRSVDLAREAIDGVDAASDPSTAARYYALLGRNAWAIGDSDAAFDAYRQAAAFVPADPPSLELARVLAEEARGLMLMSRFHEGELRCHDALGVACATGARAEEGHVLYTLGCCRAMLGYYDEGIDLVREALAIAEELAIPDDLNRAYMGLSSLLVHSGRLEQGAALVFDSAAMGEELWGVRLNGAAGNSVEALIRLGRYDEADALLAQTGNRGVGSCTAGPSLLRAAIAIRRGRFDDADRALATAGQLTAGLSDLQARGLFHALCAELALEQGQPDDAYEQIERALGLAAGTDDETFGPEICALGVRALADRLDEAQARGRRLDADKARLLALGLVQEAQRLLAAPGERGGRCTTRSTAFGSMCAAEQSRLHTSDPDLWEEAVRRWEAAREPYPAAYCRWREAEALLEGRAGRSRASDCLKIAWRTTAALATPLGARIERLAQRARIPLDKVDPTDRHHDSTLACDLGLTPREVEVLSQLAAGRTDREIAESLFISKKTASVHVSNLLRKLDVTNRVEAGKIGQAHSLG